MLQIVHKNSEAHGTKKTNCDVHTALNLDDSDRVILLLFCGTGEASFSVGAFAFATLPVCLGSMAICYVMMIARKINHQKNAPVMAKNDGRM